MITLDDVSKSFGDHLAVDGVSLEIGAGEVLALLGGSGSGKTTTLRMVNRLLEPSRGQIRIGGRDTRQYAPHELRRTIGYLAQGVGLFPHMSVGENVGITPRLAGWAPEAIARRTAELLRLVELDASFSARMPHELSGGQQQRVGLARALAADPRVLLLDEPFGALDAITRKKLQRLFLSIHAARGLSALVVTHDASEALKLGQRIAVLRDGRLVQLGTPGELLANPADAYVRELLGGDEA